MPVVSPKDWLPLGSLVVFGILAILWSLWGKIAITVTGKRVLINPRRVVELQSPISGELKSLKIRDGQCFAQNEILAIIDPSATKQQLQQQQDRLSQLNDRNLHPARVLIKYEGRTVSSYQLKEIIFQLLLESQEAKEI